MTTAIQGGITGMLNIYRCATRLSCLLIAGGFIGLSGQQTLADAYRTTNFIVTAQSESLAREIGVAAESYRKSLAIEWLGHELPRWEQPIPVNTQVAPRMGAGGATSFMFDRGQPFGWRMSIQGSRERILDSVLPHEITHTIFATHFGRPLPRWADEGACTTVEHESEKAKQHHFLMQFLRSSPPRSIPFNKMFRMTEYPHDIMPLYAQGHSVARFLLQQGGKRKFVDYVGSGMSDNDWDRATEQFYGYRDLSDLQVKWVAWVAGGSQQFEPRGQFLAGNSRNEPGASDGNGRIALASGQTSNQRSSRNESGTGFIERLASAGERLAPVPTRSVSSQGATDGYRSEEEFMLSSAAKPSSSWYARQRDVAKATLQEPVQPPANRPGTASFLGGVGARSMARSQGTQQPQQTILEWDNQNRQSGRRQPREPIYGYDAPIRPPTTMWR